MKSGLSRIVLLAGLGLGMTSWNAQAAVDWTWTLNGSPTGSNLPGTTGVVGYSAPDNTTALTATNTPGLPDLTWYAGLGYGICSPSPSDPANCPSPDHAMDNNAGKESILLNFQQKVTLSWLDIGWSYSDSDMSVLAYTGTGTPVSASSTYGGLLANGWTLVGQYSNAPVSTSTTTPSVNLGTSVSSSYWLIAAYNSVFGGTCKDAATGAACTNGDDYMKLYAVAGNTATPPPPGKVSEPTALLLLGAGLMGMWGLRRREKGASA